VTALRAFVRFLVSTGQLCARHVVDGARRHLFDGHRPGVQEVRQAMAISLCAAAAPA